MHIHPAGERGLLVDVRDPGEALALAEWARDRISAVDVVPAARTVLLDGVADPASAREALAGWAHDARADRPSSAPSVEVPVVYDGADLGSVAGLWGTDRDGVVSRHTSVEFVSAFCGFAPGFAYLAGLPDGLAVPRLESPRSRVPAGAVGLADAWCGVYPTASPGGWRLIGHTDLTLWDESADPPALLAPGTRVRFVAR